MVRVTIVAVYFLNIFFAGYVSGKPSNLGPPLNEIADDKTIAFIIGVEDSDAETSSEEKHDEQENDDDTNYLLSLLLKGQNYHQGDKKSAEVPEEEIVSDLKAQALRSGCYPAVQCEQKCKKKKKPKTNCKDVCNMIYDMCATPTTCATTKDPCAKSEEDSCKPKWGKTMPPKWKLLLRALQQERQ